MTGKIIDGRYEIIEEIGRGGMAIVYRAKCLVLNRYVAIKVLRPEFRDDAEFIKRFKIEAQSAGNLSHPNIVSIYDVGHEEDTEYIVMEYVEGITLKQYVGAKGVIPWKEAVDYASQIASGLEHAHKKGIVHKDIKPENIIITKEGILKITDFGIAKAVNQGTIHTGGLTMGSVHYFSPEQARGSSTDARTDLYSLGVLTYEMITGKLPFEGETAISVAMQHIESEPVRPSAFSPNMPKSLETVILRAMKKDPNERYQSATEMLIDLKKVYVGSEVSYGETDTFTKKFKPITDDLLEKKDETPKRAGYARTPSRQDAKKAKKKKKKKDALSIIAGVFAGIAILAFAVLIWSFMKGGSKNEIECPELVNLTTEEALALTEGTRLKLIDENGTEITATDEGIIVEQNPKYGKRIKNNAKITVTLGDKPAKMILVPSVTGMTESDAISMLKTKGFDVSLKTVESMEVEKGRVISTHPAVGTEASEGAVITLNISAGSTNNDNEYTFVPSLLGKTEAEAKQILKEANLSLGEVQHVSSSKEKGTVVKQSEAEGNRVKKNKAIDIRISNGDGAGTDTPVNPPEDRPLIPLNPAQ